ncbi:group II intron maturase-specific domain-containing protein [Paraburkholderia aspalathi]|uniref:group II intron maturase-specific domain-containing protein n=1 Tax=Paraburkholderia aspalathi TaxID=1324617 RepID=UPI0027DC6E7B|nr:group II intron maturase-specific domain-containing protein [Paraburkholderia aspalathi]
MDVVVCAFGYRKGWCEFNKTGEAENSDSEVVTAAVRRGDAIATLNPVLRGWTAYFRLTEVKGVLQDLDG